MSLASEKGFWEGIGEGCGESAVGGMSLKCAKKGLGEGWWGGGVQGGAPGSDGGGGGACLLSERSEQGRVWGRMIKGGGVLRECSGCMSSSKQSKRGRVSGG